MLFLVQSWAKNCCESRKYLGLNSNARESWTKAKFNTWDGQTTSKFEFSTKFNGQPPFNGWNSNWYPASISSENHKFQTFTKILIKNIRASRLKTLKLEGKIWKCDFAPFKLRRHLTLGIVLDLFIHCTKQYSLYYRSIENFMDYFIAYCIAQKQLSIKYLIYTVLNYFKESANRDQKWVRTSLKFELKMKELFYFCFNTPPSGQFLIMRGERNRIEQNETDSPF